jgi:uncharacterized delta-60 repeat protein
LERKRIGLRVTAALVLVGLLLLAVGSAQATPGGLDPGFGSGGKVMTSFGSGDDDAFAVALQPDGRIVVAGYSINGSGDDFAVVRYSKNGSLDASFGSGGKVTTSLGSGDDDAYGVAVQPDGKIVAVGYSTNGANAEFALTRYTPNGSLDPTFGSGGKVTTSIGSDDYGEDLALQSDGKIVVAGTSFTGSDYDFALVRYNANGTLDTTFNGTGKVTTALGTGRDIAYGIVIQADGKIVAGGYGNAGSTYDFALARFGTGGSLDSSFGSGGKVMTPIGTGSDIARGIALEPDGKIVAAGDSTKAGGEDFALVRYTSNGSLDPTFGSGGKVTTSIGTHNNAVDVASQLDGRIVAAGYTWDSPNITSEDFALIRLNADGALDSSFGSGGKVRTSVGSNSDVAEAVKLQSDGKLVAAGYSTNGSDDFALVRYLGTPPCIVPKVKGKTLSKAKSAIKRAHCAVGQVKPAYSTKVRKGRVISQRPAPRKMLAAGSKIKLKVSKGKKP